MKKFHIIIVMIIALLVATPFTVFAADDAGKAEAETQEQNTSVPRLMVTSFKVAGGYLAPGKNSKVTIKLKNYSKDKDIKNAKLSVSEEKGDIKPSGTGNKYAGTIKAGSTYTWVLYLTASQTAEIGEHAVVVSSEYEDKYYTSFTGSDAIRINVRQTVGLDYGGVALPAKVYEGSTAVMDITLLNTGKSKIRNAKIDCDIKGLDGGGTVFVGEIPAGEQKEVSVNLNVTGEPGDISGTVRITYEDDFGKVYTEEKQVLSTVAKKPVVKSSDDEKKQKKNPQWWAFLAAGAAVGGGIGCIIPISIYKAKQRKEDELRL